ncbi:MAG: ATPase domain-containing protein [Candidatus Nanoarchaeia archaeon]|jgi:circadian clock protein KaiC
MAFWNKNKKKIIKRKKAVKKKDKAIRKTIKKISKPARKTLNKRSVKKAFKRKDKLKPVNTQWLKTGVSGFDELLDKGIPRSSTILLCGGPGTGKTIFGLQLCYFGALAGEKCLYISFEESEEDLRKHMNDFGWDPEPLEKKGLLMIKKDAPFRVSRTVEGLVAKAKGELSSNFKPLILPKGFKPDRLVIDSLSAVSAAFTGHEDSYRVYVDELMDFLEAGGTTSFLITEIEQLPTHFLTRTGVDEFLADGVFVFYYIRKGDVRERACEVMKLRGASHVEKVVPMRIESGKGMIVYPEESVFGGFEDEGSNKS